MNQPNNLKHKRRLTLESLESRRCMAISVGWDGPGEGSAALSYYIANAPDSLDQATVEDALEEAFSAWAEVADVTFTQTSSPNQRDAIDIDFRTIDGPGGVLAQAYFPDDVNRAILAGDIQFDAAEAWEIGNRQGNAAFDLVQVAVHEIGHALGLEHSDVRGSVMNDTVASNQVFSELSNNDVDAVLSLYAPANPQTDLDDPLSDDPLIDDPTRDEPLEPAESTPDDDPPPDDRYPGAWHHWRNWRWSAGPSRRFGGIETDAANGDEAAADAGLEFNAAENPLLQYWRMTAFLHRIGR